MFVTMECLARLGLVNWIGRQAETIILFVDKKWQLSAAVIIILWVILEVFLLLLGLQVDMKY